MPRIIVSLAGVLAAISVAVWLGLAVKPKPFPAFSGETPTLNTVPLPADLPEPVDRYYQIALGERVPVIDSAVIDARGTLRLSGVKFPARMRFTHVAGRDYRHYIEATFFGLPLMKIHEHYLDGQMRMALPFGVIENEPKVDVAANLTLWGESILLPSIFLTDPRVRWEPIGETTARLVVPSGEDQDSFTVTFDPDTGLIHTMEALRWREASDEAKIPWRLEPLGWQRFHGMLIPSPIAVTWEDEGTPWLVIAIESVVYNADLEEYIRASGL